jgi:hypothetical protein
MNAWSVNSIIPILFLSLDRACSLSATEPRHWSSRRDDALVGR